MLSRYRVYGWFIWLYAVCVRLTARWAYEGLAHREAARAHGRVVYALWHQDGPSFCAAMGREEPRRLSILALGGPKLNIFRGFADLDGFRVHATGRLEDSAAAIESVQRDIRNGAWSAITPDGPWGPPRVCKPGIVEIVRAVDGVVLPVSIACSRFVQLHGWDRGRIPLPFSRFTVRFGLPITAARHPLNERLRAEIERGLDACSLWRPELQRGAA